MKLTSKSLLLTFREFLIVWLNQILYYNDIYDRQIYDKFKSFNLIVYKNRHPKLDDYIISLFNNFIRNVFLHRTSRSLESKSATISGASQIVCVIYNTKTSKVLRKYVINFNELIINLGDTVGIDDFLDDDINQDENDKSAYINLDGIDWKEIYTQFNTLLFHHIQELNKLEATRYIPLEDNETFFKIIVDLEESINIVNASWVRIRASILSQKSTSTINKFVPVGDVNLQLINFDVHNEYYTR